MAGEVQRFVSAALKACGQCLQFLRIVVPLMSWSARVSRDENVERRLAVNLNRALRRKRGELLLGPAKEVGLQHHRVSRLDHEPCAVEEQCEGCATEPTRPFEIPDPQGVIEALLDLVPRNQRKPEI